MVVDPLSAAQALSAVAITAKALSALHSAPQRVQDCLELIQQLHRDRSHLVELMHDPHSLSLREEAPGEWARIEDKVATADRLMQEIGIVLSKYRPETRGAAWRVVWVLSDADALANKVPHLQMQQATILSEINGLQARRRLHPIVALAETVKDTVQEARMENVNLLGSLMGKRIVSHEPIPSNQPWTPPDRTFLQASGFYSEDNVIRHRRSFYDGQGTESSSQMPQHMRSVRRQASLSSFSLQEDSPPPYQASALYVPSSTNHGHGSGFPVTGSSDSPAASNATAFGMTSFSDNTPVTSHRASLSYSAPTHSTHQQRASLQSFDRAWPSEDEAETARRNTLSALFRTDLRPLGTTASGGMSQPSFASRTFTPTVPASPSLNFSRASVTSTPQPSYDSRSAMSIASSPPPFSPSLASVTSEPNPGYPSPPTTFDWTQQSRGPTPSVVSSPYTHSHEKSAAISTLFGRQTEGPVPPPKPVAYDFGDAPKQPVAYEIDDSNRHVGDVYEMDAGTAPYDPGVPRATYWR